MRICNGKRKKKIVPSLLLILLLCCGCGQRESGSADSADGEGGQQSADGESAAVITPIPQIQAEIAVAPLLVFEDPETQNLAGMLQAECGSMMVQLEAGQFLGSGILYRQEEDALIVLTAGHVLADAEDGIKVTFVDGWAVETSDFEQSGLADMAAVRIPLEQIPGERLGKYYLVNVDKDVYGGLLAEEGCIVMGCRTGVAEDAYEGIVLEPWIYMEDYDQYMMWVRAPGKPGMSGGGLFDRRGHFLGLLSGRSEDGEWAVVPLGFVLTEYN